jgi:tetratricopeptide (TPR) repeat protein
LIKAEKLNEAYRILDLNSKVFPDHWNVYDSLGEINLMLGEKQKAIENYQKSLELNPGNSNAREMLTRISLYD